MSWQCGQLRTLTLYLGVRALLSSHAPRSRDAASLSRGAHGKLFADGFVVALLNPKTALFFAAFLPQFLPVSASAMQTFGLGGIFVAIAAATDTGYALASSMLVPWIARRIAVEEAGGYLSGSVLIGLGVFAALSGRHSKA
ncbi:MAG: LysE family translocator [Terriglobales bacterium]